MTIQVEILQFLHYNPSSSRAEIAAGLNEAPNERTLKRIIAEVVQQGDIVVEGKGRATRYSLSAQAHLMIPLDIDTYFLKDIDERKVQESFNFDLIRSILPQIDIFTAEELERLNVAHQAFLNNMATTMANTVKWGITSSIFNNMTRSVQDAFYYVKGLNSSLTDIRIVT